ncbi:hypothetical protein HII31_03768, partial [Pseudocercospora fuligena]
MCTKTTHRHPSKGKGKPPIRKSPPPVETITSLISRFQHPQADLVSIYLKSSSKPCSILAKTLLVRLSPYFKNHITTSNTLILPTSDPLIFGIFLFWLINDRLPRDEELDDEYPPEDFDLSPKIEENGQTLLVRIWNFAGEIDVGGLQNECIRALFETLGNEDIQAKVFEKCLIMSPKASLIRKALIMYMLWHDDAGRRLNDSGLLPQQRVFLRDSIDVGKIEGLEVDMKECEKAWKIFDEEG